MQDLYVVNQLTQDTEKPDADIKWHCHEGHWQYAATINRGGQIIDLKIGSITQRTGSRTVLELSTEELGKVYIEEPHLSVSFRRKYDSQEDKELAEALARLSAAAKRQYTGRELLNTENKEERKQAIFRKIIGIF